MYPQGGRVGPMGTTRVLLYTKNSFFKMELMQIRTKWQAVVCHYFVNVCGCSYRMAISMLNS